MIKIISVFGTRPEAIKLAPLMRLFNSDPSIHHKMLSTGQHSEMLVQVLEFFDLHPDFNLDVIKTQPDLTKMTSLIIEGCKIVFEKERPDLVIVHGDTTSALSASLSAFYQGISVGHVEAGLRTHNLYSPWPEELNRKFIASIAKLNFAPTENAKSNLLLELVDEDSVFVTGNTVIDSLFLTHEIITNCNQMQSSFEVSAEFDAEDFIILATLHRRENIGVNLENICKAIREVALNENVKFIIPVHKNPKVRSTIFELLSELENVELIEPVSYEKFVILMSKANFILTDSGGIQEEAPSFNKPVLVVRDTSERPEAIDAGTAKLVGTKYEEILLNIRKLIHDKDLYLRMSSAKNPYGDGTAARKIKSIILDWFDKNA